MKDKEQTSNVNKLKILSSTCRWSEKALVFNDTVQLGKWTHKCELIMDPISHYIYLYDIPIKLQPQEYEFLKILLHKKYIKCNEIMKHLYKIKNKVRRIKEDAGINKNTRAKNKLTNTKASYKILSKIRNKVFQAFLMENYRRKDGTVDIESLEKELQNRNKKSILSEYEIDVYFFNKIGWQMEINPSSKTTGMCSVDINKNFKALADVSQGTFFTCYKRYKSKKNHDIEN